MAESSSSDGSGPIGGSAQPPPLPSFSSSSGAASSPSNAAASSNGASQPVPATASSSSSSPSQPSAPSNNAPLPLSITTVTYSGSKRPSEAVTSTSFIITETSSIVPVKRSRIQANAALGVALRSNPLETVLNRVFQFLDVRTLLQSVGSVCQLWRKAARDPRSWKVVHMESVKNSITNRHIVQLSRLWSEVVELDFFECFDLNKEGVTALAACLNVRKINFTGCLSLTDEALKHVGTFCKSVTDLDLTCCRKISDQGIAHMAAGCPQLRRLKLWGCAQLTDLSLKAIGDYSRELEELDLTWCKRLQESGFKGLGRCVNLKRLVCTWCERVKDGCIEALSTCRQLVYLDLDGCSRITDSALKAITVSFPQLRVLHIRFLSKITLQGVTGLVYHAPLLADVDASYCDLLPTDGAARVKAAIKRDVKLLM